MNPHPVQFRVERPDRMARVHVGIRLALIAVLVAAGRSPIYLVAYVAIPAVAALLVSDKGWQRYFKDHAPAFIHGLRWVAAVSAYLSLLTDVFPTRRSRPQVALDIQPDGQPTPESALWRIVFSVPALVLLALLSAVAALLWLIGAVAILSNRRVPEAIAKFIELTLRYQFRLLAYHLSLVARYPSLEPEPQAGGVSQAA